MAEPVPSDDGSPASPPVADPLMALGLGTFHTLLFFVPVLLLLHLAGNLEALLVLGTLLGAVVFLVFWGLTFLFTFAALRGVADGDHPLKAAAFWGAAEGLTILAALAIAIGTQAGPMLILFAALAAPFALALGALFGSLFAAVDRLLLPRPG